MTRRRCACGPASRLAVHDGLPEDVRLKKTVARLASYLQGYGYLPASTPTAGTLRRSSGSGWTRRARRSVPQ